MKTNEKDQKLLKLYIENEDTLKEVSRSIDETMEDPLAGILKSIIKKRTLDFENFNSSDFITRLTRLCQYKCERLFDFEWCRNSEKETLIYLASLVTLDDFVDSIGVMRDILSIEDVEKFQNTFKEVSMIIYSLISHVSGGNISIIEDYISEKNGKEFSFVLSNMDFWVKLRKSKEKADKELESYS